MLYVFYTAKTHKFSRKITKVTDHISFQKYNFVFIWSQTLMERRGAVTFTSGALGDLFHEFPSLAFHKYSKPSGVSEHVQNSH